MRDTSRPLPPKMVMGLRILFMASVLEGKGSPAEQGAQGLRRRLPTGLRWDRRRAA